MSNRKPFGIQADVIDRNGPYIQDSFDLDRLDNFVTGLGVEFFHYKSLPSPIGQNDRGDYHRNDGVDTITSNGMIYKCAGKFTATMTDNSRDRKSGQSGFLDPSESRLVMPRFYNKNELSDGDRIYLSPGDRIYVADLEVDILVSNYQKLTYESDSDNIPMFPIVKMDLPIVDSRNIEYKENIDYIITQKGNIRWLSGGKNPGIDPQTKKGRVYSIRYLYKAYWYVTVIHKEIRITNVTTDDERKPERMSYFATVQREFMYHNQNRGDKVNQLKPKDENRAVNQPSQAIESPTGIVVDMAAIGEDGEQS